LILPSFFTSFASLEPDIGLMLSAATSHAAKAVVAKNNVNEDTYPFVLIALSGVVVKAQPRVIDNQST
jgi:hypothetical protein